MGANKRIGRAVVQTTYAGSVKSLFVDAQAHLCELPSLKLLDRELDRIRRARKSLVPDGPPLPATDEGQLVSVSASKSSASKA